MPHSWGFDLMRCWTDLSETEVLLIISNVCCLLSWHRWSHEYQEATIEKILRFLKGQNDQVDGQGASKGQKKKEWYPWHRKRLIWDKIRCQIPCGRPWTGQQLLPLYPKRMNLTMFDELLWDKPQPTYTNLIYSQQYRNKGFQNVYIGL